MLERGGLASVLGKLGRADSCLFFCSAPERRSGAEKPAQEISFADHWVFQPR